MFKVAVPDDDTLFSAAFPVTFKFCPTLRSNVVPVALLNVTGALNVVAPLMVDTPVVVILLAVKRPASKSPVTERSPPKVRLGAFS